MVQKYPHPGGASGRLFNLSDKSTVKPESWPQRKVKGKACDVSLISQRSSSLRAMSAAFNSFWESDAAWICIAWEPQLPCSCWWGPVPMRAEQARASRSPSQFSGFQVGLACCISIPGLCSIALFSASSLMRGS